MSSSSADVAWRRVGADGSITLAIYAQPGAKRTEVKGVHNAALKIQIAAPAVEGRANDVRNVTLVRGETGRRKTLRIASPAARPDRDWGALGES